MSHPDTLIRMCLAIRLRNDVALTPVQRTWLQTRLTDHMPLTARERARVVPALLAWLDGYDAGCAERLRGHLAGSTDMPGKGARSHEGLVKLLTIIKDVQDREAAKPAPAERRRRRIRAVRES